MTNTTNIIATFESTDGICGADGTYAVAQISDGRWVVREAFSGFRIVASKPSIPMRAKAWPADLAACCERWVAKQDAPPSRPSPEAIARLNARHRIARRRRW